MRMYRLQNKFLTTNKLYIFYINKSYAYCIKIKFHFCEVNNISFHFTKWIRLSNECDTYILKNVLFL